jgi:hypothetical protein
MSKKDNNRKSESGGNEVLFPLLYGILSVIIMAIVSHFMGN